MFADLQGLALGIIGFAIIIGVGVVVLDNFGDATASCSTVGGGTATYNVTQNKCVNGSGTTANPVNDAWVSTDYLNTQMGTTGLAGWTPAIVALSVGLLFLGAFIMRGGSKKY